MDDDSFEYLDISMAELIQRAEAHLAAAAQNESSNSDDALVAEVLAEENSTTANESLNNDSSNDIFPHIIEENPSTTTNNDNSVDVALILTAEAPNNPIVDDTDDCIVIGSVNMSPSHYPFIDLCSPAVHSRRNRRRRAIPEDTDNEAIVILDDTQAHDEPILIQDTQDILHTSTPAAPNRNSGSGSASTIRDGPSPTKRVRVAAPKYSSKPIPRTNIINNMNDDTQEEGQAAISCPICLDSVLKKKIASTICGHIYCYDCIKEAIKITKKCPMCKKSLKLSQIHPIYLN